MCGDCTVKQSTTDAVLEALWKYKMWGDDQKLCGRSAQREAAETSDMGLPKYFSEEEEEKGRHSGKGRREGKKAVTDFR